MENSKFFEELKKQVKTTLGEKGSHAFDHTERVYNYALLISKGLDVDLDIVKASALLHDIARLKEERGEIKDHAAQGVLDTREILEKANFPKEKIDIVCKCILLHNKKEDLPEIKEIRVLKEADGLETIGAMGIGREFSFNGEKRDWDKPGNPLKLVLKNLNCDYFKIPAARKLAERKIKFSKIFYNQFVKEYNLKI